MYENMNLQQLQEQKAQLLQKQQEVSPEESEKIAVILLDIEEAIEEKMLDGEIENEPKGYTPAKGTDEMVHLKVVNGHRFDSSTGAEISKPYKQMFTRSEWNVFKKHHRQIGFEIVEVLHDPTNEAQNYVMKKA